MEPKQERLLKEIAKDILLDWNNVNLMALLYLEPLLTANKITDMYIVGSYESIVLGFLANAETYRGEKARELKGELKNILNK